MDLFTLFKTVGVPVAARRAGISRSLAYSIAKGTRAATNATIAAMARAYPEHLSIRRTVERIQPGWGDAQIALRVAEIERLSASVPREESTAVGR